MPYAKRLQSALFNSLVIFLLILHAIYAYEHDRQSLGINFITVIIISHDSHMIKMAMTLKIWLGTGFSQYCISTILGDKV